MPRSRQPNLLRRTSRPRAPGGGSPSLSGFGDGSSRFGSPLDLWKVHRMRPEMLEVSYAEGTTGGLLRQVGYLDEHGDKPATDLRRNLPD